MADHGTNDLRERPTSELLKQLSDQTTTLVRQEIELAKLELQEKGKKAGMGAGMFGGAGVLGLYAVGALTATIILALATFLPGWVAALIVTVVSRGTPPSPTARVPTAPWSSPIGRPPSSCPRPARAPAAWPP